MAVQYYFDNLDSTTFQRLINALLTARFGEAIRLLPLRGIDGGRDAETAPPPVLFEVLVKKITFVSADLRLQPGRYLFQVKHHRMSDHPGSLVRSTVLSDFNNEIITNVLDRGSNESVNYFFLVTNVPSSKEAVAKLDEKRKELLANRIDLHADILWQEHVISWLDQSPRIWPAYPELFAGSVVPLIGQVAGSTPQPLPRSVRLAIEAQSKRDGVVRFRQINLEQRLSKLFVDLDVFAPALNSAVVQAVMRSMQNRSGIPRSHYYIAADDHGISCIGVLTAELPTGSQRIIVEGGPGQGKSTVSQMLAQLYRSQLLEGEEEYGSIWENIQKVRFPFRIELRFFAEWLGTKDGSVEQFLAESFSKDAGGGDITVESIHSIVENQSVLLIFDGLDEVGSDDLRDTVITKISECLERFEVNLKADLKTIITTRPPAIAGRAAKLPGFLRAQVLPLSDTKIVEFVQRWTDIQCADAPERDQVSNSFAKRKSEQHVNALAKNPMQLSVLLHFIRLKGEAFPDRRAELYRDYFKTVIDRDVEKSPQLRRHRDDIEMLHEVIGFEIHSRAELDAGAVNLSRDNLIQIVRTWLTEQGKKIELADELFRLGEERLGLIMVLKGEGADAQYGFDVQPIREYFTAAYINDKCERNAHELFQLMVRRSFWHEVALFLAGLRRANEKADLLSRARTLDDEITNGWRSDGRGIVMQLLQEGVLTSPGHVRQEAICFLLEGLDPSQEKIRHEPRGVIGALPDFINSCDSQQPRRTLRTLLDKALEGDDRYAIWRLFSIAQQTLPKSELEAALSSYTNSDEDTVALVKLLWPSQKCSDFCALLENEKALLGQPQTSWAKYWFQAALEFPALATLSHTANYHEFLLEQFAFQPIFKRRYAEPGGRLSSSHPYAIWRLCENVQYLAYWLLTGNCTLTLSTADADFSGLTSESKVFLEPLLETSTAAIERLRRRESVSRSFQDLICALDQMLGKDGLAGWIASRFSVTLMQYAEGVQLRSDDGRPYYTTTRPSKLSHIEAWRHLRRNLTPLFRVAIPHDLNKIGKTFAARILELDLVRSCPSHIRINGKLESVPALIVKRFENSLQMNDWLQRAPFAKYWIPELIRVDPSLKSLAVLSHRSVEWFGGHISLSEDDFTKVLSLVDQSNDPALSAGALTASIGTKCWNIAKVGTLGKMIEADAQFWDFGARLFRLSGRTTPPPIRIRQLADAILKNKYKTSLSTSSAAAKVLTEYRAVKLPPLCTMNAFGAHIGPVTE
jgi:hypothetical protein